jgi:putative peptidoglycan lipid II flippase
MTAPADLTARAEVPLARSTATITAWNAVSRVTGFVRVLAVGGALGATFLGNTYQSSNLVSNLLFELLAAGLLAAPLVPAFVRLVDTGDHDDVERLAGELLALTLIVLGAVVLGGAVAGRPLMRLLTVTVHDQAVRAHEVRLGAFFLWFFLPQALLYAVGALASALLNADRRFAAPAFAPVANNVVVTVTMAAFLLLRHGHHAGLDLPLSQRLVLAVGTTAGVLAMTIVPLAAARRAGFRLRPRFGFRDPRLREVGRVGAWGAVLLSANQLLIGVTLVLANRVEGGVVAYQIAFTFFLLPVALAAQPVFTALYPRLAALAHGERWSRFGDDLAGGARVTLFLVLPASAALIALGQPVLRVLRVGALSDPGALLVARVLAAYGFGLAGYALFMLLARAAVAAGDARLPALVGIGITVVGAALMATGSALARGTDRVVALGLAHSIAMTGGAVCLFLVMQRRVGHRMPVAGTAVRGVLVSTAAGAVAALVVSVAGSPTRGGAALAVVAGTLAAAVVVVGGQLALGGTEIRELTRGFRQGTS